MNGGYKATPHVIKRVTTADGSKVLYENTYDSPPRCCRKRSPHNMNMMLMGVIDQGTGRSAKLPGWQAAGKTGTTQSFRDALFVGYTANLTTGVWFGNDDGKSMKKVTGGGLPAKAWSEFMIAAHKGLSPAPLFGLGGVQPSPEMVSTDPQSTTSDQSDDNLFDMISHALGGSDKPRPVVRRDDNAAGKNTTVKKNAGTGQAELPTAEIEDVLRKSQDDQDPALVPPMDVGQTGSTGQRKKANSTLLDVIMQQ
jgi:penicillin-binding protein 1A